MLISFFITAIVKDIQLMYSVFKMNEIWKKREKSLHS